MCVESIDRAVRLRYADCERTVAAFTQVLDAAGIDAWTAAHAQFKLESRDDCGFLEGEGPGEVEGQAAA